MNIKKVGPYIDPWGILLRFRVNLTDKVGVDNNHQLSGV